MTYYETMYIVHPALESGRLKDLILSVQKSMDNLGGETCAINVWGKKKLAYPINKEKYGMYVLLQFESDGSKNKEFNVNLDHNSNILGYLTTKINADQLLSDVPDLDQQLGLLKGDVNTENIAKAATDNTSKEEEVIEETASTEEVIKDITPIEEAVENNQSTDDDNQEDN